MKKLLLLALLLNLSLALAACAAPAPAAPTATPVDIGAVQTASVQTVIAPLTQTAAAASPTPLPPTETATPQPEPSATTGPTATATVIVCDNATFIADVSMPDGTQVRAGEPFVKTWKVKNAGSCTWTRGYQIIHAYGERIGGQATALSAEVLPGEEAEISINLTAPLQSGTYSGYWRLTNNNGSNFGEVLTVVIVVP
jgi:hypothetical protein